MRRYSELIEIPTFEERLEYLKLNGSVGFDTFGFDRYLNQRFYHSTEWRRLRDYIISRDDGCDLGCYDRPIGNRIYIHHMNPLTVEDVMDASDNLLNAEYLICVSHHTHNLIHYGNDDKEPEVVLERTPGDTKLW